MIPGADEYVRFLLTWWVTAFGCLLCISPPCYPSEAKPILASFSLTITTHADIVCAFVATCAIVVKLVFNVFLATVFA